jgi:hypothetical protein
MFLLTIQYSGIAKKIDDIEHIGNNRKPEDVAVVLSFGQN